jgi:hypothetical protein
VPCSPFTSSQTVCQRFCPPRRLNPSRFCGRFACGSSSNNCELCFGNATRPPLVTASAAACQAACEQDANCAAFQWIGTGDEQPPTLHHQCLFKCEGAVSPGRTQCTLGHKLGSSGGDWWCGPKHNDSSAPAPPPSPPLPPGPPPLACPVPFGLSGGQLEAGTNHARAGSTGAPRHDLLCRPYCLFNLTSGAIRRKMRTVPRYICTCSACFDAALKL